MWPIMRVLAQLSDQRDRANTLASEIAARRQVLAYTVLTGKNEKAQDELTTLNQQLADLAVTIGDIDGALLEARKRLDAAKASASASNAEERRVRVRALLLELEACAPTLDRTGVHPETGRVYRLSDPQARAKSAALIGAVLVELRALGIAADAEFPAHWEWSRAAWQDLRKAIIDCMNAGWPGPAQRVTARERDSFTALLAAFARIVRGSLGDDQTNKAA